jgi:hypothetical protein
LDGLWKVCGVSGLLAFVAESLVGRSDAKRSKAENEKQQAEIGRLIRRTENTATALAASRSPRHLDDTAVEIIRKSLSPYAGQRFQVRQVGYGDVEAQNFAKEIGTAVRGCGWEGETQLGWPANQSLWIHSGVAVTLCLEDMLGVKGDGTKIEEMFLKTTLVQSAFKNAGVALAEGGIAQNGGDEPLPEPKNTLLIVVGPKPRQ